MIDVVAQPQILTSLDPVVMDELALSDRKLVLATQDCDLVKPADKLPALEAILCFVDQGRARRTRPNDSRFFVLNPSAGLLADRAHITSFTREALDALPPPEGSPFAGDSRLARRFARWLGARYDRPALPNEIHEALTRPLKAATERFCQPGRSHEWLNDQLHEVRVAGEFGEPPPWEVMLLFVLGHEAEVDRCQVAIAEILVEAGISTLPPIEHDHRQVTVVRWAAVPTSRLPVLTYWGSQPLDLDGVSALGGAAPGAGPLRADSA